MATGPKTLSQLPIASSIAGSDRILILSNPATVPNTVTVTANAFAASIAAQMPIANTLSAGVVIVGNTLTVNVTGGIQVNTNLLLTNLVVNTITTTTGSSANLTIDPDGSGDVVFTSATQVFVQSATGATSTSAGDFVVSGGVAVGNNIIVGSSVNAASLTVGTAFVANATGVYTTGTINAASHTVGTATVANATGVYTTGTINAASHTVGTAFVANSTVTTITDTTAAASSTQTLIIKNGSYSLGVIPNAIAGAYNSFVAAGDTTIVAVGNSGVGNANLAIVPWSGAAGGLRMITVANSTTFAITGNTTITGFANVSSTVNAAAFTIGTTFIANTTGTYQTGTAGVNAVSYNIGTTFIANSTALTFTPNTYNFGSNSVTANGYVYLPGGMKMQWGSLLVNTTTAAQTWPTAYTTNVYSITATANTIGTNVAITTANSTKFTVITGTTANVLVYWTAVGT